MRNIKQELELFLHNVQKPARYLGNELNIVIKEDASVRGAISYPDLYEVGMSNNGIRILYEAGNRVEGAACERVFAVAPDFESELRYRGIPLYTLESYSPLSGLDFLGFNLSHELLATNMLQVLDLGGVPMLRSERGDDDPLVIAGGEAVSNPFPYADFVDLFFIGDGEEGFPEMLKVLVECNASGISSRVEKINALSRIEGVLSSGDYDFKYDGLAVDLNGMSRVRKVDAPASACFSPDRPLVPSIRTSHERIVIELARGCSNLCKFCHAGYYNLPYRPFDYERAAREMFRLVDNTGYDEITLTALSVSDYRHIVKLLNMTLPELTWRGVSVALPSLKVDRNTLPIIETVSSLRKSSLTFAVESASDELRSISNKKVRREDLFDIVDFAFSNGWSTIKLYFMIGLPGCENVDEAEEIILLLKEIAKQGKGRKDINVTVSPFVPKPHTPFEFKKQMSMEYFHEIIRRIKSAAPRRVTIKNHDVRSSFLEGLISRGDTRTGSVILEAYRNGARLDSWHEYFRFDTWSESMEKFLPAWRDYFDERGDSAGYPWQVIETAGAKAINAMRERRLDISAYRQPENRYPENIDRESFLNARKRFELKYPTDGTLRLIFSKTGHGRYIGHIDFIEVVKRGLRMAGVPVSYSQGFSKREKISSGYPVPLGVESLSEIVDIDLYEVLSGEELHSLPERINHLLPDFVRLISVRDRGPGKTIMSLTNAVKYSVEFSDKSLMQSSVFYLEKRDSFVKRGKKGETEYPLSEILHSYEILESSVDLILFTGNESSVRADEFISGISGSDDIYSSGTRVIKLGQYSVSDGVLLALE